MTDDVEAADRHRHPDRRCTAPSGNGSGRRRRRRAVARTPSEQAGAPRRRQGSSTARSSSGSSSIVAALVIALVIKTFLFQAFYIPSESMVPTLEVGDRVLVNKLSYDLHDVNRGDIVVFEASRTPSGTAPASRTS